MRTLTGFALGLATAATLALAQQAPAPPAQPPAKAPAKEDPLARAQSDLALLRSYVATIQSSREASEQQLAACRMERQLARESLDRAQSRLADYEKSTPPKP